jgi:outer membrane lipoprotein-sorting protein
MFTPLRRALLGAAVIAAAITAGAGPAAQAADLTVDEIVEKANYTGYYQGADGRAKVEMAIIDEQGRERKRIFTILRRDAQPGDVEDEAFTGDQRFYVYFERPADVNKTAFLVWKHPGKDDNRWLYLPGLDLVKPIAPGDKRTSFVGSHFFYEDVSGRGTDRDAHELVETNKTYYVVKSTPKNPDLAEFAYFKSYIHKKTFLPVQIKYFDGNDQNYRTYTVEQVKTIDGFLTITTSKMEDKKIGGHTTMTYNSVEYNIGLPEDIFTERYLRTPPRKHLR